MRADMASVSYNKKCDRAFELLDDSGIKRRIKACAKSSEFGFAILLHFVQLEAALKIIRYWERATDGWPDNFGFLNANWGPLRDLKAEDRPKYDSLIGVGGNSLRKTRNQIAHEGCKLDQKQYETLACTASWALGRLRSRLPPKEGIKRKISGLKSRRNLK